jgi:hypothetical protein
MTNDTPPVAPVEGHYAMLRNGEARGPIIRDRNVHTGNDFFICPADNVSWNPIGDSDCGEAFDIIATISPEAMAEAVALSQQPSQEELSKGRVVSRFEWGETVGNPDALLAEMSSLLHATFLNNLLRHTDVPHENRMLIQSQMDDFALQLAQPFIDRLAHLEALVPLADAVLDHADAHCRAFPIETAPKEGPFLIWIDAEQEWVYCSCLSELEHFQAFGNNAYKHWAPLPPPPTNPPLPAAFVELGQALEKLKDA